MDRKAHYEEEIIALETKLLALKQRHRSFSTLRLILFLLFLGSLYLLTTAYYWGLSPLALTVFVVVLLVDTRLNDKIRYLSALKQLNEDELASCSSLSHPVFGDGKAFINHRHPYSYDIDIFGPGSIFQKVNRCVTRFGKHKLSDYFSSIEKNTRALVARQEAIDELLADTRFIQGFIVEKYLNPNVPAYDLDAFLHEAGKKTIPTEQPAFKVLLYGVPVLFLVAVVFSAFTIIPFNVPIVLFLLQLFIVGHFFKRINRYHNQVEKVCKNLRRDARLYAIFKTIQPESSKLKTFHHLLVSSGRSALNAIKQAEKLINAFDNRMNLLVTLLLNGLYLRDLWLISRFNKWIENYSEQIPAWIEALSELDTLVSLANYNSQNPGFVKPVLSDSIFLSAQGLGHPLIDSLKRVNNNIELNSTGELFIVTGANMAGKSTFLRTVLINLVLASTGSRVCADYFVYKPSNIFSSIRTFDNLIDDVSYFQAELIRLKEMMSVAQNGEPVMVAIDEPLKGTNSEDKRKGSMLLLKKMIELPVCGLVATHDLELKVLADENRGFKLVCFELDFDKGKVIYDYKLKPGVASTMNATLLMKDMGLI